MSRYVRIVPALLILGLGLTLTLTPPAAAGGGKKEVELGEASVYIEWNSTDTDFGIQFFWDGDPWRTMRVKDVNGKRVLNVRVSRSVAAQGMTEGFFESAEPPASELSMAQFMARFPEGDYSFRGRAKDGGWLVGEAEFKHDLPSPPSNLSPAEDDVVSHEGFTVSFDPVTTNIDGDPINIELYVVVVEKEDDDPILQTFEVILPPDRTSVTVPAEFLEEDTEYKLEIIAQEESGNRTITESGAFTTDSE